jgi:hypothetical protein
MVWEAPDLQLRSEVLGMDEEAGSWICKIWMQIANDVTPQDACRVLTHVRVKLMEKGYKFYGAQGDAPVIADAEGLGTLQEAEGGRILSLIMEYDECEIDTRKLEEDVADIFDFADGLKIPFVFREAPRPA